jgi:hypothetical protein
MVVPWIVQMAFVAASLEPNLHTNNSNNNLFYIAYISITRMLTALGKNFKKKKRRKKKSCIKDMCRVRVWVLEWDNLHASISTK